MISGLLDFFNNTDWINTALAWVLTLIVINGLVRLKMTVKARYTSWGFWLVITNGIIFGRLPEVYGWDDLSSWLQISRAIIYAVVIGLAAYDWRLYYNSNHNNKNRIGKDEKGK